MKHRCTVVLAGCAALLALPAYNQVVTVSGPSAWTTQRNDALVVRAQVDTAQLKKKAITVSLEFVDERAKKKTLVKKSFAITNEFVECTLGPAAMDLAGGRSYLKIDWSIPGSVEKGVISPVGIVALDKLPGRDAVAIACDKECTDPAHVAAHITEIELKKAGSAKYALRWNKEALFIIIAKRKSPGTIRFAFDGKNGKNAFLSYADRVVLFKPENDSAWGNHYSRRMAGDTLQYDEKPWPSDMTRTVMADRVVLRVPWYDIGIIPQPDRWFGLCVAECADNGRQIAAAPAAADFYLPGTWGDCVLAE